MEIILYIAIPALLVLVTAYFLINRLLTAEEKRRDFEVKKSNSVTVTPVRLRAYERLTLVLERTSPHSLLINCIKPEMNCLEFQSQLLQSIRQEFEHNASQQIYVSSELWSGMKNTRENLIKLVNSCATRVQPSQPATVLAELILQVYSSVENTPDEITLNILKAEVRQLF